ncbi:MAG: AMP-binding protein, partial [Cyclobacteriaceae bacterium]
MTDYPWFKNYPEGTPKEIGPYEYTSLIEMFDNTCDQYSDQVAFENYGVKMTFKELHESATHFAAYLQGELGLKKGDRIAIQMPNLLQFPVAFFGAIKAGLIAVNTNPLYTPPEMKHQFVDAEVSAVVIVANFAKQLEVIQ